MKAPNAKYALVGIIAIFIAQQSFGLQLRWVEDETWYLLPAQNLAREGRLRIPVFASPERNFFSLPPLLPLLEAALLSFREPTVAQTRLIPLAFAVGSVVLAFLLARRLADQRVATVAAALMATDNMIFLAGRTVRPEIIIVFFSLLTLWLLVVSVQDRKASLAFAAGLSVGAGMSSHPNGAIAALCAALLLLTLEGWRTFRGPRLYLLITGSVVAFAPYVSSVVINEAARDFEGFRALGRMQTGRDEALLTRLANSAANEADLRFRSFIAFPYRVHIGVLSLAAVLFALARSNRAARFLAGCVVIHLLFFLTVTNANKSPRYLALVMPYIAVLWAMGIVGLWTRVPVLGNGSRFGPPVLPKLAAMVLFAAVGITQLAGNLMYLWKSRDADVEAVCRRIDALIPPGSTVYGGMAFWIGLQDHEYVPYQRMPWKQAVEEFHPTVLILDDRVMVHGSGPGEWDALRNELHAYVDSHGKLLGSVFNSFYGDLKIYEVPPGPLDP